jgi:hypothetical protein
MLNSVLGNNYHDANDDQVAKTTAVVEQYRQQFRRDPFRTLGQINEFLMTDGKTQVPYHPPIALGVFLASQQDWGDWFVFRMALSTKGLHEELCTMVCLLMWTKLVYPAAHMDVKQRIRIQLTRIVEVVGARTLDGSRCPSKLTLSIGRLVVDIIHHYGLLGLIDVQDELLIENREELVAYAQSLRDEPLASNERNRWLSRNVTPAST